MAANNSSSFGSFLSFLGIILASSFNSRYVKKFVTKDKHKYEKGRENLESDEEHRINQILQDARNQAPNLSVEWKDTSISGKEVLGMIHEHIFIVIKDLNDLKFTVHIEGENSEIKIGWDTSKHPTLVIPLMKENIYHLAQMFGKGKLIPEDMYRIAHFVYIAALKSFYNAPILNEWPNDKSYLKLDNFIHVELKNEHKVQHEGQELKTEATILNVDGQWLVFEGFQGDPDVKYSASLEETLHYHHLILHKATRAKTISERKAIYDEYMRLRNKTLVYERNTH